METDLTTQPVESSPTNDAPAESSPAQQQAETAAPAPAQGEREAFLERVAKAEGRAGTSGAQPKPADTDTKKDEEKADSPPTEETDKPEGAPKDEPKKDEPGKTDGKPADKSKQDDLSQSDGAFSQRPEWRKLRELTGDKFNTVRPVLREMYKREEGYKQQVEKLKLSDQVVGRLRTATKGDQGLNDAIALIERFDADPASSVPMLEQLLADAKTRAGLEISSPDLRPKVDKLKEQLDNGLIDEATFNERKAELAEIEKSRAERKAAEAKIKATQESEQQRTVEKLVKDRETAIQQRIDLVWSKDPDYPKIEKFFFVRAKENIEQATEEKGGLLSAEEMVQQADAAWKAVKAELTELLPKPRASRPIVNNGSSRNVVVEPKSELEAFRMRVREREGG